MCECDYETIKTITEARLFMRNYVYDEDIISILETIMMYKLEMVSFDYNRQEQACRISLNSNYYNKYSYNDLRYSITCAFKEFMSHPAIIEQINACDYALDHNSKEILHKAGYDINYTATIIDITQWPNIIKDDVNNDEQQSTETTALAAEPIAIQIMIRL